MLISNLVNLYRDVYLHYLVGSNCQVQMHPSLIVHLEF